MYIKKTPEGLFYVTKTLITSDFFPSVILSDMDYERIIFMSSDKEKISQYSNFKIFSTSKIKGIETVSVKRFSGNIKADVLFDLESQSKDLMHVRNSSMNQVVAKWFKENNIIYGISMSSLKSSSIYGKVRQNLLLVRKYEVPVMVSLFDISGPIFSWYEAMNLLRTIISL